MTASLETLVVAAYVFADALPNPRPGPEGKITDAELVSLAVAQAAMGESSDRKFLGMIGYRLEGWFAHLPDQTQYNRRLRRLTPEIVRVQLAVAELIATGRARLVDGTLISVANYAGCASRSEFAGHGAYGYCASKSEWVWGMRLILLTDEQGVPLGYELEPANEREYEATFKLAAGHPDTVLVADKGLWGREFAETLRLCGVEIVTPARHRLGERPPEEVAKAGIRLVIESVFANLKEQMGLRRHLARTLPGLAQRIAQRLLALTLGMFINAQIGRPLRALVAFDGR